MHKATSVIKKKKNRERRRVPLPAAINPKQGTSLQKNQIPCLFCLNIEARPEGND